MKMPTSNRNRYSFLQCSQHEEGECDDDNNLQETYASVTARQNSNLHSILSPGSITPGQRHQNRTQCKKLPKLRGSLTFKLAVLVIFGNFNCY